MEWKQRESNKISAVKQVDIVKEMRDLVNKRLDDWNEKKKEITNKNNPVNKDGMNKLLFDIKPWTIWWFEAGENVGMEIGTHVDANDSYLFSRPCIVISKVKTQLDSNHSLVTVLPMSTKSEGIGIHKKYLHKLEASNYPRERKLKGLTKDSYIIGHQIKTIDTKRLIGQYTKRINEDDISAIRDIMKKYIDIM